MGAKDRRVKEKSNVSNALQSQLHKDVVFNYIFYSEKTDNEAIVNVDYVNNLV